MPAKTPIKKGPLWKKYRFTVGRKLKRGDKRGVVLGELDGDLKVLWLDDSTEFDIEEKPIADLEEYLLEEFDNEFAFKTVVQARERGWTRETQREKRKSQAQEPEEEDKEQPEDKTEQEDVNGNEEHKEETSGKEKKQGLEAAQSEPATPSPANGACMDVDPDLPEAGVRGLTRAIYPKEICFTPGDQLLERWSVDDEVLDMDDSDFYVERIVDQRVTGGKTEYLVKWKGYQLNPGSRKNGVSRLLRRGDWVPSENVENAEALDVWEKSKPQYYLDALEAITPKRVTPPRAKKRSRPYP